MWQLGASVAWTHVMKCAWLAGVKFVSEVLPEVVSDFRFDGIFREIYVDGRQSLTRRAK